MKTPPFYPDKMAANPDSNESKSPSGHKNTTENPPVIGEGWDGGGPPNKKNPHENMRKTMCRANNLSIEPGNCPICKNPDACEKEIDEIAKFITRLHEKRAKGAG